MLSSNLQANSRPSGPLALTLHRVPSPLGELQLVMDSRGSVRALDFESYERRLHSLLREHYGSYDLSDSGSMSPVEPMIARYFAGDLSALADIPVATNGTVLQRQVWAALREIPPGSVTSYGNLARRLGLMDWQSARDVGQANAANPIAIIVPCHRVIGKDGDLRGFAGGLHRKQWLLGHEKAIANAMVPDAGPQLQMAL